MSFALVDRHPILNLSEVVDFELDVALTSKPRDSQMEEGFVVTDVILDTTNMHDTVPLSGCFFVDDRACDAGVRAQHYIMYLTLNETNKLLPIDLIYLFIIIYIIDFEK